MLCEIFIMKSVDRKIFLSYSICLGYNQGQEYMNGQEKRDPRVCTWCYQHRYNVSRTATTANTCKKSLFVKYHILILQVYAFNVKRWIKAMFAD